MIDEEELLLRGLFLLNSPLYSGETAMPCVFDDTTFGQRMEEEEEKHHCLWWEPYGH